MPIRELIDIFMKECRFQGENRYGGGLEPVVSPLPLQLPQISGRVLRTYTGSELIYSVCIIYSVYELRSRKWTQNFWLCLRFLEEKVSTYLVCFKMGKVVENKKAKQLEIQEKCTSRLSRAEEEYFITGS